MTFNFWPTHLFPRECWDSSPMPPRPVCARLGIKLPASEYIRPALHQLHHYIPIPTGHRSPEGMQSNNVTLFPFFLNTFQLVSSVTFLKYERMCGWVAAWEVVTLSRVLVSCLKKARWPGMRRRWRSSSGSPPVGHDAFGADGWPFPGGRLRSLENTNICIIVREGSKFTVMK